MASVTKVVVGINITSHIDYTCAIGCECDIAVGQSRTDSVSSNQQVTDRGIARQVGGAFESYISVACGVDHIARCQAGWNSVTNKV